MLRADCAGTDENPQLASGAPRQSRPSSWRRPSISLLSVPGCPADTVQVDALPRWIVQLADCGPRLYCPVVVLASQRGPAVSEQPSSQRPALPVRPTKPPAAWAESLFTVGVTGTNGKTSTTRLIDAALRAAGLGVVSETTLGYQLNGQPLNVPRTLPGFSQVMHTAAQQGIRHAAIEVTSKALANGFAKFWRFDLGVFTNLSRDHLLEHGSFEHYLASKAQLFMHLGPDRTAVLNAGDEHALLIDQVTPPDVKRLWFAAPSRGQPRRRPDLAARRIRLSPHGTTAELVPSRLAEQLGGELRTRLVGQVFAENAMAAAAAAIAIGIAPDAVCRGLADCPIVPGRFEVIGEQPLAVVDYAHTPDALARTCDTARALAGDNRVIVVFGAGGLRDKEKRKPMGEAVAKRADLAIVTTDNPRAEDPAAIAKTVAAGCRRGSRAHTKLEPDRRRAIELAVNSARPGDVVVVAGKGHETGQIIGDETLPFSDADELRAQLGQPGS